MAKLCRICGKEVRKGEGVKYLGRIVHPKCKQAHAEHMKRKEQPAPEPPDLMERTRAAHTLLRRANWGKRGEDLELMFALTAFCGYSADDAAKFVRDNRREKEAERGNQ